MRNQADGPEVIKNIIEGIRVLKKQYKDLDERLTFYEERCAKNRVMIEENRADIDRIDDERL